MRLALILLLAVFLPLPSQAQEAQPPASATAPGGGIDATQVEEWRVTLLQAQERVVEARAEVEVAQRAFRDARRRNRRGDARGARLAELQEAQSELAEAEARLPELVEQARRAGVPHAVLREFEG